LQSPEITVYSTPTTTLLPSQTATLTKIPTLTPLPSQTATLTKIPTLTPLPTYISYEEDIRAFNKLLRTNGGCQLPCWWGITPGETTWDETHQFIQRFRDFNNIDIPQFINPDDSKVYAVDELFSWYSYAPGLDYAPTVEFEVHDNLIATILVPSEIVASSLPLHIILQKYGIPDEIYVGPSPHQTNDSRNLSITAYIIYQNLHAMISIGLFGMDDNRLKPCEPYPSEILFLWAPGTNYYLRYISEPDIKSFEQVTALTPTSFYNKYKTETRFNKICMDITDDVWK